MSDIYDIDLSTIAGRPQKLAEYRDRVLLVVNVASRCGYTPQYAGLEALYREYHDRGFDILGFPCDQFLNQEPGDEAQIQGFCSTTYNVTFPLFGKIKVNGPQTHPLFKVLKAARRGLLGTKSIKWNFTKFLIDRTGRVVKRYAPRTSPADIERDVAELCGAPVASKK